MEGKAVLVWAPCLGCMRVTEVQATAIDCPVAGCAGQWFRCLVCGLEWHAPLGAKAFADLAAAYAVVSA